MLSRFGLGLGGVTRVAGRGLPADLAVFADGTEGFLYDFSKLSKLWKDTSATTPVAVAGDNIARSDDSSSRGRNATQATTAFQPKWQTGGAARFDGLDDVFPTTHLMSGDADTLMAKVRVPASLAARPFIMGTNNSTQRGRFGFDTAGRAVGAIGTITESTLIGSADMRGQTAVIALSGGRTSDPKLYLNGVLVASFTANGTGPSTTFPVSVGALNNTGNHSDFWGGDMLRALAIKKALTADEIAAITNYWGTT